MIQLIYALHIGAVPIILGYLLPPVIAARTSCSSTVILKGSARTARTAARRPDDGTAPHRGRPEPDARGGGSRACRD